MVNHFSIADVRDRLQQLSVREQLLVLGVVAAAIWLLFDVLVFTAQNLRAQEAQNRQTVLQAQIQALSVEMATIERSQADQLEQKEREFHQLKQQVAQLDALAGSVSEQAPAVGKLVSEVLAASSSGVRAVGVKTVPVKSLFAATRPAAGTQGNAPKAAPAVVYRYGVDIELRGNYLDLMKLLARLEDANPRLFWSSAVLNANAYPENTLRASVFLLSKQANL